MFTFTQPLFNTDLSSPIYYQIKLFSTFNIRKLYFVKRAERLSKLGLHGGLFRQRRNKDQQKQQQINPCCIFDIRKIKIYNLKKIMQSQNNKIMIGSYPYRGNVNICRLICQYLDLPYENIFFNPLTWKVYKEKQSDDWLFQQLPFLIDGTFVVTQAFPMCQYIVKKSGQLQLLGKNIDDALVVDNFMWGKDLIQNVLSLVVEHKNNPKKLMQQMHSSWIKTIRAQLLQYEKNAKPGQFYLGYITVIDFILHEIFEHYKSIFRKEVFLFPKLLAIREKVASIPRIKQFQKSQRTVHEICPLQFYKKWKLQTLRATNQNQT